MLHALEHVYEYSIIPIPVITQLSYHGVQKYHIQIYPGDIH
jgi:hypothetical protein